jgi:ABC-type antimicrobial peptide transport system permease subunit
VEDGPSVPLPFSLAGSPRSQHWSVQIPAMALYGGVGTALVIGAIAGLHPSMRAARFSPTEALRTVCASLPRSF